VRETLDQLKERAEAWANADSDPETAAEMRQLVAAGNEAELTDRLDGRLQFGTAGLRGILGAGPNRMNRAVARQATAGLARYLLKAAPEAASRGVVVGRDARRLSAEMARDAASVLAAYGIPALVIPDATPTPHAAFGLTHLGAGAAVVVTASHNPPEYNGYKVYWGNGAQIVPPHDRGIAAEIEAAGAASGIPMLSEGEARTKGLWRDVPSSVGESWLSGVLGQQRHPGAGRDAVIVTTALHGVGGVWLVEALSRAGFGNVHPVPEQQTPDGAFPTVAFPNPEEKGALDLTLALAERTRADLLLANDPDADRLAVGARDSRGTMRVFSGNETGVLLGHYALTQLASRPEKPLLLATIVSSSQLGRIAASLGARYEETLTGFKWLMNRALEVEAAEGASLVFAYEEALGYSVGDVVRDKDGIGAGVLFADLCGWCRARGVTAWDYLAEIQRAHGLFVSSQRSVVRPGREGQQEIAALMERLRRNPPGEVAGEKVASVRDYELGIVRERGTTAPTGLPKSNVLAFLLEGGARVTVRPSGTEPKVKVYFERSEVPLPGEPIEAARSRAEERLRSMEGAFVI
jgi:phosphomannomutase